MMSRFLLVALAVLVPAVPAWAACEKLPAPVKQYLQANPQWRLVDIKDLDAEDQGLWRRHRGQACPGFTAAKLDASKRDSYALALVSKTPEDPSNRSVVLWAQASGFSARPLAAADKGRARVIWRTGPGMFKDFYSGAAARAAHDAVIYERMGSNSTAYYLSNGAIKSVLISD